MMEGNLLARLPVLNRVGPVMVGKSTVYIVEFID
jgi:hypothetical protein